MERLSILLVLWSTVALAETMPVYDKDFNCIPQERAQAYRDFNIDLPSFGGLELCNSSVDTKRLFNDLDLIAQGHFTGNVTNTFIRNFVDRTQYINWLQQQTRGIDRGNDIPWATAYNSGGYFTMQDGWAKLSTLGRVGTVVHEARHTEGYGHFRCEHGPYKDAFVSGCDQRVESGGSHAIEMEYYARVALEGDNFHPVYQAMARLMLLARSNFVFNVDPMSQRETLMARTSTELMQFKDNQVRSIAMNDKAADGTMLKRTSFGATLYNTQAGNALAVDLSPNAVGLIEDDYSYFKLLKTKPPENSIDMEEFDIANRRYLFALDSTGRIHSYIFGNGDWTAGQQVIAGANRLVTMDPQGNKGIFVVMNNQSFCPLNLQSLNCSAAPSSWPVTAKAFVPYREGMLTLTNDGHVNLEQLQNVNVNELVSLPEYDVFQ